MTDIETVSPTFIKHKGKTYILSRPTIGIWEDTARYLRDMYLSESNAQLKGLHVEVAKEAYKYNKQQADKIKPVTEEFLELLQRPTGFCYFAFLVFKIANPTVTLDEVADVITDGTASEYAEKVTAVMQAAGLEIPNAGNPTTEPKG